MRDAKMRGVAEGCRDARGDAQGREVWGVKDHWSLESPGCGVEVRRVRGCRGAGAETAEMLPGESQGCAGMPGCGWGSRGCKGMPEMREDAEGVQGCARGCKEWSAQGMQGMGSQRCKGLRESRGAKEMRGGAKGYEMQRDARVAGIAEGEGAGDAGCESQRCGRCGIAGSQRMQRDAQRVLGMQVQRWDAGMREGAGVQRVAGCAEIAGMHGMRGCRGMRVECGAEMRRDAQGATEAKDAGVGSECARDAEMRKGCEGCRVQGCRGVQGAVRRSQRCAEMRRCQECRGAEGCEGARDRRGMRGVAKGCARMRSAQGDARVPMQGARDAKRDAGSAEGAQGREGCAGVAGDAGLLEVPVRLQRLPKVARGRRGTRGVQRCGSAEGMQRSQGRGDAQRDHGAGLRGCAKECGIPVRSQRGRDGVRRICEECRGCEVQGVAEGMQEMRGC
ncbi:hypothetical protein quinque_002137 [Culex quinquefasciatus]